MPHVFIDFIAPPGSTQTRCRREWHSASVIWAAYRHDEVCAVIHQAHQAAQHGSWVVGWVSYEAAPAFDPAMPVHTAGPLPLAWFAALDGPGNSTWSLASANHPYRVSAWQDITSATRFHNDFAAIHRAIEAGDTYQINYSTRLHANFSGDPLAYFLALHRAQPDGYCAYLGTDDWQIASASPELFFHWENGQLITGPVKGTCARSTDAQQDAALAQGLRNNPKEQAENLMIVDLLRNDLARISLPGSVKVPALFDIQGLPTLWQMVSRVHSQTRADVSLNDVFQALFPCGSIIGAPKIQSMHIIRELETQPRGVYCGAIGVLRPGGAATFNVAIRTVTLRGTHAECGVGGGFTWDSDASLEHHEFTVKRRFLERASMPFSLLETLRLENGHYWLEDWHWQRLARSAQHFHFPYSRASAQAALHTFAQQHAQGLWRVRLLLAPDGQITIQGFPLADDLSVPRVTLASHPIDSQDEFLYHKTTQRAVYAPFEPTSPDVFDTLLWNERGELTEFTRGNVVVRLHGTDYTPPVHCGLLAGCLRDYNLAQGRLQEKVLTRADLAHAEAVYFINSVRGMHAVQWVNACDTAV